METLRPENIRIDSLKNLYQQYGITTDVLRLDLIHPVISGNKWFKLKFYLEKAKKEGREGMITFGGAYSNHIIATAWACREAGLSATAIIRGEMPDVPSQTLANAKASGMQLHYVSRAVYKTGQIPDEIDARDLLIVPEGGYGKEGAAGAATISAFIPASYNQVILAAGTGTTLAGLMNARSGRPRCTGISVLKNNLSLKKEIKDLMTHNDELSLRHEFHFGGYAKYDKALIRFMNDWYDVTGIPTDFVYTGKLAFAMDSLIRGGYFKKGDRVLMIHSGGLQGNTSLPKGTLIF